MTSTRFIELPMWYDTTVMHFVLQSEMKGEVQRAIYDKQKHIVYIRAISVSDEYRNVCLSVCVVEFMRWYDEMIKVEGN